MAPRWAGRWLALLALTEASIRPERIPVLDLKALNNPDQIEALGRACAEPGFFHVINHGVPRDVIDAFEAATRAFFALPTDVKRRVKRTATNSRGFADDEFTKRTRDYKEMYDFGHKPRPELADDDAANHVMDGWNQMPDLEGFREGTAFGFGSGGIRSRDPVLRRCGYSAVTITAGGPKTIFGSCPGRQTVPRAELYALACVIRLSRQPAIRVFVDPEWIVKAFYGDRRATLRGSNADLWSGLWRDLDARGGAGRSRSSTLTPTGLLGTRVPESSTLKAGC